MNDIMNEIIYILYYLPNLCVLDLEKNNKK